MSTWEKSPPNKYLARISIRHELNNFLISIGGHVGYDVRPSERGKGYGHLCLKRGIEKAREIGLKKLLITCDKTNEASKKIIHASGAKFENEYTQNLETPKLRYWLQL